MKFGLIQLTLLAALVLALVSCGKSDKSKSVRPEAASRAVRVTRAKLWPMERTLQVVTASCQ